MQIKNGSTKSLRIDIGTKPGVPQFSLGILSGETFDTGKGDSLSLPGLGNLHIVIRDLEILIRENPEEAR